MTHCDNDNPGREGHALSVPSSNSHCAEETHGSGSEAGAIDRNCCRSGEKGTGPINRSQFQASIDEPRKLVEVSVETGPREYSRMLDSDFTQQLPWYVVATMFAAN